MLQIGFLAYQFEPLFRDETICGVTQRQAPALTWDSELHVIFMTNQMKTDFGFILMYKRVNGKLSLINSLHNVSPSRLMANILNAKKPAPSKYFKTYEKNDNIKV